MKPMVKKVLIGFAVVAVLLFAVGGYKIYQLINPPLPKPLPALGQVGLTNAEGQPVPVAETVEPGVPTVLSFWASWCAPCIQESKALAKLRAQYPDDQLNIIYINADPADTDDKIAAFYARAGNPDLPIYRADHAAYSAISGQTSIALPRSYIFNAEGIPTQAFTGYGENAEEELGQAVADVVK